MEATCPSCKAQLKNVQPNVIGRIRCGSCGHAFDAPGNAAAAAPGVLGTPTAPDINAVSPAPKEPLGKEPQPANYGLLVAVGYAALLFGLGVFGWQMYRTMQLSNEMRGIGMGPGLASSNGNLLLKSALQGLLLPGAGLAILVLAGNVVLIDRRASWLAWRSGSLARPITQPEGSSLPYILPFCVSGGVLLIFGMQSLQSGAWAGGAMMPEGTVLAAAGAVLFLAGLGCGELWRFFWRMGQLGKALVKRQRGDELSIGAPIRSSGFAARPGTSSIFMRIAVLALFIAYVCVAWMVLEMVSQMNQMYGDMMFSNMAVNRPSMAPYYGNLLGGFLGVVGGAYTLFLLTRHWDELVRQWRQVGASAPNPMPQVAEGPTSMFRMGAWILLAMLVLLGLYAASEIGKGEVRVAVFSLAGLSAMGLALCWLAGLKSETFDLRRVTARAANGASANPTGWIRPFSTLLLALASASVAWGLFDIFNLSTTFGRIPFAVIAYSVTLLLTGAMPFLWLAMMVRDADAIRAHLDGVTEK